jgi:hypothetical protein
MKRMELIANRSVEEEIMTALEHGIKDFYYTLLPAVHGKGKTAYRLGTATWPEENFMLISYLNEHDADKAASLIENVKSRFTGEGIKLFFISVEEN